MALRNTATYTAAAIGAADANTPMWFCKDFKNCTLTFFATWATATVKVYGSSMEDRPDLDSAASATNEYVAIETINADTWDIVDWATGIARTWTATNIVKYTVNNDGLNWIGVEMTARTAWSVIVKVDMYDNS